eukprot:475759-Hanusia_phi.AAC.1
MPVLVASPPSLCLLLSPASSQFFRVSSSITAQRFFPDFFPTPYTDRRQVATARACACLTRGAEPDEDLSIRRARHAGHQRKAWQPHVIFHSPQKSGRHHHAGGGCGGGGCGREQRGRWQGAGGGDELSAGVTACTDATRADEAIELMRHVVLVTRPGPT